MFYAPNYFVGKGPMGRIWLAAHWDKKLTKAIIEKEDIIISIDQVFHNADLPPLALRLSGHLLVGITRIYSRKVKYLLNDCSDALQKIKTTFRQQAQVDLPAEDARASLKQINSNRLPETVADLDMVMPDLPDIDPLRLGEDLDLLVAPQSEITMRTELREEERASLLPETEAGEEVEEEDLYGLGAAEREAARRQRLEEESTGILAPERSPRPEEGFGDEGHDFMVTGDDEFPAQPVDAGLTPASPGPVPPTSPIHGDVNLEVVPAPPPREPPAPKRKRLAVDRDVTLSSEQMREFLQNSDNLVRDLIVAPPTKKALVRREWELSSAETLLTQPSTRGLATVFTAFFHNLLRTPEAPVAAEPQIEDGGMRDFGDDWDLVPAPEQPEEQDVVVEPFLEEEPPQDRRRSIEQARLEEGVVDTTGTMEIMEETDSFEEIARKRIQEKARRLRTLELETGTTPPPLNHKLEVATLFVQLLQLKTNNKFELVQPTPYANIITTAVEA